MNKTLYFCTGNDKKWQELRAILGPHLPEGVLLAQAKIDLPELQGGMDEIARQKCILASQQLPNAMVVTEDTCMGFDAMAGLPGPYIKWFLQSLGLQGLAHLAKSYSGSEAPTAKATCTLALFDPATMQEPKLFVGITDGVITEPRGPTNFGWDPVFQPVGHAQTYAEMPTELKNTLSHRQKALKLLIEYFERQQ